MKLDKRLFIVTLEPIEKRYTKQWLTYWHKEFSKYFKYVENINGTILDDKIKKGRFLDINQTNIWKAEQTIKIAKKFQNGQIKDGDVFIFMDGWDFAITALRYMSQLNKVNIKIYAYWHAGTWDEYDFITQAGLRQWARFNEAGWFNACDGHFVATKFHKKLIKDYFGKAINPKKIYVVGFPMDWDKEIYSRIRKTKINKDDIVVFPHRIDIEKCPEVFDIVKDEITSFKPNAQFIKTMEVTKDKKDYYQLLQKSKVVFSASKQETFGIGTVEAMCLRCIPIVPDRLSYVELYDREFRYKTDNEMIIKVNNFLQGYYNSRIQRLLNKNIQKIKWESLISIKTMAGIMNGN